MSRFVTLSLIVAGAALAACSEQPQTLHSGQTSDAAAFHGPSSQFTAAGWKPGEQPSWEQALKTRTVNGQNEYTRVN